MMGAVTEQLSGSQVRTRNAILAATASVIARNRAATLPDIAQAAGVGRTTVHRYFPDRECLMTQTRADSIRMLDKAIREAATDQGPARDAMRRAIAAMASAGDRILFLFDDPAVMRDVPPAEQPNEDLVLDLIRRGQEEGVFTSDLSVEWIEHTLFALVHWACRDANAGTLPRHAVVPTIIRTFEGGCGT
jgi:AcrR family transcriptional regulator